MFWSKWPIIHLIGQKHIWREGLLQRDGASKMHLLPLKLRLIETGKSDVPGICLHSDGPQYLS